MFLIPKSNICFTSLTWLTTIFTLSNQILLLLLIQPLLLRVSLPLYHNSPFQQKIAQFQSSVHHNYLHYPHFKNKIYCLFLLLGGNIPTETRNVSVTFCLWQFDWAQYLISQVTYFWWKPHTSIIISERGYGRRNVLLLFAVIFISPKFWILTYSHPFGSLFFPTCYNILDQVKQVVLAYKYIQSGYKFYLSAFNILTNDLVNSLMGFKVI